MPQEHDTEDAFASAARRLGAKRGIPPERFIREAERRLEAYEYPTGDCLRPEDIAILGLNGALLSGPLNHAGQCPFCRQLVESIKPKEARVREFVNLVSAPCDERPAAPARKRWTGEFANWSSWAPATAVGSVLCVVLLSWIGLKSSSPKNSPPVSVFDHVKVEEASKIALASTGILTFQGNTSETTEALVRGLVAGSAARAYSQTIDVDYSPSRQAAFQSALTLELANFKALAGTPGDVRTLRLLYRGVQAEVNSVGVFNKIDARWDDILVSRQFEMTIPSPK